MLLHLSRSRPASYRHRQRRYCQHTHRRLTLYDRRNAPIPVSTIACIGPMPSAAIVVESTVSEMSFRFLAPTRKKLASQAQEAYRRALGTTVACSDFRGEANG